MTHVLGVSLYFVFIPFFYLFSVSQTISPLDMYPRLLRFQPVLLSSHGMSLARPCICPLVVARGNDQVSVTTKYEQRTDAG